jgi:PAS domain S-box-containing protein
MARLKIINGVNAGESVDLKGPQTLLGRHSSCDVVLSAGKVSRQHARIVREEDNFFLEDLRSRNGTFVNGRRVESRTVLHDGDRIELADCLLAFRTGNGSTPAVAARPDRSETIDTSRARPSADSPAPHIVRSIDALDEERLGVNAAAKLRAMLELWRQIGGSLDLDDVLNRVLEGAFAIFPQAERGYVLLAEGVRGRLEPRALKLRRDEQGFAVTIRPISRTITQRVMTEQKAILSSDVQSDDRFVQSESVLDFEIRSMMCAPLIGPSRRALGLVYLDTQEANQEFTETDLDLLLSISTLAAQAVEYTRVHRALLEERQAAEEAVRASEARFRAVWDNSADAMRLTDGDGFIIAVNRAYCDIVGLPAADLEGRLFTDSRSEAEGRPELLREYRAQFQERSIARHEERTATFRSGRTADLQVTNSLIEVEPGSFVLLSIFRDLTDKKQTETALRVSEERFGTVLDEATIGIAVADARGYIVQINPAFERIVSGRESELLGRDLLEVLQLADEGERSGLAAALFDGRRSEYRAHKRYQREAGQDVWVNLTLSVVRDVDERLVHLIALLEDVSDRRRLEREVADQAVAEQQRIGQELHDELGQILTGMNYLSSSLASRLKSAGVAEAEAAEQVTRGIQQALTQVRTIAKGLVPVEIDKDGLRIALHDLAARIQEIYGTTCSFKCSEAITVEDNATAVHLYHIAQEAITNAIKHGNATRIEVHLQKNQQQISLTIRDNGSGMPVDGDKPSGVGLRIMRYRAGVIGAALHVKSSPGQGTTVSCILEQ